MEDSYKELTYKEALEFYSRWGRTILVGNSPTDCYKFNRFRDKKSLDDCIKQYLNYYDGPVRFFLNQRTIDYDMQLNSKNESKDMNKKHIRLTESDLHRIVKESVGKILNDIELQKHLEDHKRYSKGHDDLEVFGGKFGEITYRELFDSGYWRDDDRLPYLLEYSQIVYHHPSNDSYTLISPIYSKQFKTYKECINFCQENSIKVVKEYHIGHPLAKGIPDTRSIKPWSSPEDFS